MSESTLSALSPTARALIEHAASNAGQRARARDLWDSLVGLCVEVEALEEGEPVLATLPAVRLPFLGGSVPMLLQAEVWDEGDTVRVIVVTEPDPEALAQLLEPIHGLLAYALRTTTELRTDPATLIPRHLMVEREHQLAIQGPNSTRLHTIEAREWLFEVV